MEFALVAPLVLLLALAVIQLALALHLRSVITAAAAEGARAAALAGSNTGIGEQRTRALLAGNLAEGIVERVQAARAIGPAGPMVEVAVEARLPVLGLLGPSTMHLVGRSLAEPVS